MFQLNIWSVPPLLAALVSVGVYYRVRSLSGVPGMRALLALLAAIVFWSGAQFIGSLLTDASLKLLVAKIACIALAVAPVTWFVFAVSYSRRQMRLQRWVLNPICLIPLATIVLAMTNELHGLVWARTTLVEGSGIVALAAETGPWMWVHATYSYTLMLIGTTILAWALGQTTGEWKPVLAVVVAPLVVCLTSLYTISPWNSMPWIDMSTLGFAAAAMILDGGVLRYGVLESVPVLRDRVVEELSEGVVVIDVRGMIIDINTSALNIFRSSRGAVSATSITNFVTTVPLTDLTELDQSHRMTLEITMHDRAYDVSASILDESNDASDVVLVLRDVTDRRKTEYDLRRAQEELVRLAHTDYLTGIHNRRFFMQRLAEEIERVRRHGSNLSVLLFDLDHFKRINDTCGHHVGDAILKSVADASMDIKRITDVAARIGGEEFALLLPETDQGGAVHLAQRLREAVSEIHTQETTDAGVSVTTSVGVATVGATTQDLDNVLNHADDALYQAKAAGRNAVCTANVSSSTEEPVLAAPAATAAHPAAREVKKTKPKPAAVSLKAAQRTRGRTGGA